MLTLPQALKATLLCHRHNLTEELLTELLTVSRPTILQAINIIERALDGILKPLSLLLAESLKAPGSLVNDGTLIPIWNWRSLGKTNFSGKYKHAGFNHQIICAIDGKLLPITNPLLGARHDAFAFKEHGLDKYLGETTLADRGYIGLGLLTPAKRKPGVKMPRAVKDNNRVVNRLQAVAERVIAQTKTWRILHSFFCRPLASCGRVFSVVPGVVFYAAGKTFEEASV